MTNSRNQGKPFSVDEQQEIDALLRARPHQTDDEIADAVAEHIGNRPNHSSISRRRKELGIPNSRQAAQEIATPLREKDQRELQTLLSRMFLPSLHEMSRQRGPEGMEIRSCASGELSLWRKGRHVVRCWLNDVEEEQLSKLLCIHLPRRWGAGFTKRFCRLLPLVARHLDRIEAHYNTWIEGGHEVNLIQMAEQLDSAEHAASRSIYPNEAKLIELHPVMAQRIDRMVSRIRASLGIERA